MRQKEVVKPAEQCCNRFEDDMPGSVARPVHVHVCG